MRLRFTYLITSVIVSSIAFSQPADSKDVDKTPDEQRAYKTILMVEYFALGGVGFAGETSAGESAFKVLLSSKQSKKYFELILRKGNVPAKLYALCGLREVDSTEFIKNASQFRDSTVTVATMRGCIGDEERFVDILQEIKTGFYDVLLRRHAP